MIVQKENALELLASHLTCSFSISMVTSDNLGISVRFGMRNKAGGEPKKRTNSVVVAKTLEKSLR